MFAFLWINFQIACSPANAPVSGNRIQINFWHGMGGPLGEVLEGLIDEYNAQQTRYIIKGTSMGSYDTLQKKILASVVAHRSPDISQNFEALTLKLSRAGKLVCLDDLIAREPDPDTFRSDIIPVLLANNLFDGKLWSFPFNKSVPVLYYNKDMFREAGLDPERPPRTIEELYEYARKLTRDTNGDGIPEIWGFAFTLRNEWNWGCRLLSCRGTLMDEDIRKPFLDSEAALRATRSYADMILERTGKFAEGYDHQNEWLGSKIAMFESSIVSRVYLKDKIKFAHGVAPISYIEQPAVLLSGTNINVYDNGSPEKIEGAWDFIKWFTSTEIGARWSLGSTYLPVRLSSLNSKILQDAFASDTNIAAPYSQVDSASFEPRIPEWFECRIKISEQLEQIYIKTAGMKNITPDSPVYTTMIQQHLGNMQTAVSFILENSLDTP